MSSISQLDVVKFICRNSNSQLSRSMVVYESIIMPDQPEEREDDNREYKLFLEFDGCKRKFEQRSTQLLNRLIVGDGKALYLLGLSDDGQTKGIKLDRLSISINNVCQIANNVGGAVRRVAIYNTRIPNQYVASVRLILPKGITDDIFIM